MSFTYPLFYVCLAAAAIGLYSIGGRWRSLYLLVLSYGYYALSSRLGLGILIASTGLCYWLGIAMVRTKNEDRRALLLTLGVSAIAAIIVVYKTLGATNEVLLPLGLSYYSFKLISYLFEVSWDDEAVVRDPVAFFLFPAFFPQIVSGPIQRPDTFFRQIARVADREAVGSQIEVGFRYIIGGLMLKLIVGDRLSEFIDTVDLSHANFTQGTLIVTIGCYTLQLYADFAGYTNIALGIGKFFGIDGPPNFDAPFMAVNIQDMWRRWHMSLTSWLTDYLFTPVSMSLRSLQRTGLIIAIAINMVAVGVWHGFTLNYLVFGMIHAVFLSTTVLVLMALRARRKPSPSAVAHSAMAKAGQIGLRGLGMLSTFAMMSFSQIFFHSETWSAAVGILRQASGVDSSGTLTLGRLGPGMVVSVVGCSVIAAFDGCGAPGFGWVSARLDRVLPRWLQYGFCIFLLSVASSERGGRFIYDQF